MMGGRKVYAWIGHGIFSLYSGREKNGVGDRKVYAWIEHGIFSLYGDLHWRYRSLKIKGEKGLKLVLTVNSAQMSVKFGLVPMHRVVVGVTG